MAKEIERKFLVTDHTYRDQATHALDIKQAYLSTAVDATVRLRLVDGRAWLTVKSKNHGCERNEWEYPLPYDDALQMIEATGCKCLSKRRYIVPANDGLKWEVDEFTEPAGLVIAEIELPEADSNFDKPAWLGQEVTGDPRYYNSAIVGTIS